MTASKNEKLFYWGIMLSSLDSFPAFSGVSTYAPYFAILFYALYYLSNIHLVQRSMCKKKLVSAVMIIFAFIISFCKGIQYDAMGGFVNFSVQLLLAILLYKSFNIYFQALPSEKYMQHFARIFVRYTIPVLCVGVLELFLIKANTLYEIFVSLFSHRVSLYRLQLLSGEPSWASRLLLVFLAVVPFAAYSKKKEMLLTGWALVLMFATGSALGILCTAIYYAVAYFKKQYLAYYLCCIALLLLVGPIIYDYLGVYAKQRFELLYSLWDSDIDLETLAVGVNSGSIMARLGNPILGFAVGRDHWLTGVGGGYYYMFHMEYLGQLFPDALSIHNIYETGMSPKNLFSRVFAEQGIFGLGLIFYALLQVYRRVVAYDRQMVGLFVCMILLTVNFDNLFHIYPLLLFCVLWNHPLRSAKRISNCANMKKY